MTRLPEKMIMMINGRFVDPKTATISVWDRAIYFGDGVYEVMQSYAGRIWAFDAHIKRFERSLREIGIDNVDIDRICGWIMEAFEYASLPDSIIYFHVSRGLALRSHLPPSDCEPQFLLYIMPAYDNTRIALEGVKAITYPDIRWRRCDIKSLNLLPNVMAVNEARRQGCDDAVFILDGNIMEGSSSTFFAVVNDTVITRPLDSRVLPGITRQAVRGIARRLSIGFKEDEIPLERAYKADELFLAGTGYEIRGIVRLDGRDISGGRVGPITKKIIDFFRLYTRSGGSFEELVS